MAEWDKEQQTEEATEKQQSRFRERGEVAKSQDIGAVVTITASLCGLVAAWPSISGAIFNLGTGVLGRLDAHTKWHLLGIAAGKTMVTMVLPVAITVAAANILAQFVQVGWNPTAKPLMPDFKRMNPLPRLRQLFFSVNTLIELGKSLIKVSIIGLIVYNLLSDELTDNGRLAGLAPAALIARLGNIGVRIVIHVGVALAFIAALDFLLEKHRHKKKMRMTKEQVKQEHKDQEGDPLVKSRIRGKQRETARARMIDAVNGASVVVVNPTHYSVAIKYDIEADPAPVIAAAGVDQVAAKIRERARQCSVPVVSNPPLARALYTKGEIGGYIPQELYQAVASILAWVYRVTGKVA